MFTTDLSYKTNSSLQGMDWYVFQEGCELELTV